MSGHRYSSNFEVKVDLRRRALADLPDPLVVLDAFHGHGEVWDEVARRVDRPIEVVGVDRRPGDDDPMVLRGDNKRVLRSIDLERYSLIDLDAYGLPADQLAIVAERAPHKPVMVTAILHNVGTPSKRVLRDLGVPELPRSRTSVVNQMRWPLW